MNPLRRFLPKEGPLKGKVILITLLLLWTCALVAGMFLLMQYASTPGETADVPKTWPGSRGIVLAKDKPTLMMFMHPHCPCSRASLEELSRLVTRIHGKAAIYALFYSPSKFPRTWTTSDTWHAAQKIPGVQVLTDPDGHTARDFHATISGQVLIYDPRGVLRFNGGITPARGHAGDNKGSMAVQALITKSKSDTLEVAPETASETVVFGCPIIHSSVNKSVNPSIHPLTNTGAP